MEDFELRDAAYVYLLLCREDMGPVYAKLGVSQNPLRRLRVLGDACPAPPRILCVLPNRTKRQALAIGRRLHRVFTPWMYELDWFRVPLDAKSRFNAAWQAICPQAQWRKLDVPAVIEFLEARQECGRARFRRQTLRSHPHVL